LRVGGFGQPAIEALDLLVSGNPGTALAPMVLPEGTTIFFGEVADGTLPGAVQIFIQTATEAIPFVVP
jgi:hypothetical protein